MLKLKSVRGMLKMLTVEEMPQAVRALGVTPQEFALLRERVMAVMAEPLAVAMIGETGVGKTTTINRLFGADLPTSHSKACTEEPTEIMVKVKRGALCVVDMPGLGEDEERDELHFASYARVLPRVDLVLWILKADNRAIAGVQRALRRLVEQQVLDPRRLVVALNQVDALNGGGWNQKFNIPSVAQEVTLAGRVADVRARLTPVVYLAEGRVVAYSAEKNYRLADLLEAMVQACDQSRKWRLADLADFKGFDADVGAGTGGHDGE